MSTDISLEELWDLPSLDERVFRPDQLLLNPKASQLYLEHAIKPGTQLASAVRLPMHGEIKLGHWLPFTAEQVIRWNCGMVWRATVYKSGIPTYGSDRMVGGEGSMRWKLLRIFPVMSASGPDTTRSAIGRVQVESIWLPSALCNPEVSWTQTDPSHAQAHFAIQSETANLDLALQDTGRVTSISMDRWGNPDASAFRYVNFGGTVEEEGTFDGYTIPTRLRVGWYFGTSRFESDGEFFRVVIDRAQFR